MNDKSCKQGKRDWIKFVIWSIWIGALVTLFCIGKGKVSIDFLHLTTNGISVAEVRDYIIYYGVLLLLFFPALIHGKNATCHYICWMAPFMIIGSSIGRLLHIPQLHIEAKSDSCISCKKCNQVCPMGLNVERMVRLKGGCASSECIQCGACADNCPKKVLQYSMKRK